MCLYKSGFLPDSFDDMFFLHSDVHSSNTGTKIDSPADGKLLLTLELSKVV